MTSINIDKITIDWIGRVTYNASSNSSVKIDKIWGVFSEENGRPNHYYVVYGHIGKKLTIIKHEFISIYDSFPSNVQNKVKTITKRGTRGYMSHNKNKMIKKKLEKKYINISLDELNKIFPDFLNKINLELVAYNFLNNFE